MNKFFKKLCIFMSFFFIFNCNIFVSAENFEVINNSKSCKIDSLKNNKASIISDTTSIKTENSLKELDSLNTNNKLLKDIINIDFYKLKECYFDVECLRLELEAIINPNIASICFEKEISPPILS